MIDYKKTGLKFLGFIAVCGIVLGAIGLGIYKLYEKKAGRKN